MTDLASVPEPKDDPRLNICDLYIFSGAPGRTTMAMTVSADAGLSSPQTMHPEGLYAFRFDLDGDEREDLALTFRFDEPRIATGDTAAQAYVVEACLSPALTMKGRVLVSGRTGSVAQSRNVSAFAGLVPELFAADGEAFRTALRALHGRGPFDVSLFDGRANAYRNRNVMGAVLEVPDAMLGAMPIHAWATVTLVDHARESQICRAGFPLFTPLFLSGLGEAPVDLYHATAPNQDRRFFGPAVAAFVERFSRKAGWVPDPDRYGWKVANLICPSMIPYKVGVPSIFETDRINGRPLAADAFDTMLSIAAGRRIADGVTPPSSRLTCQFPYYGRFFSADEQAGLLPLATSTGHVARARDELGMRSA